MRGDGKRGDDKGGEPGKRGKGGYKMDDIPPPPGVGVRVRVLGGEGEDEGDSRRGEKDGAEGEDGEIHTE